MNNISIRCDNHPISKGETSGHETCLHCKNATISYLHKCVQTWVDAWHQQRLVTGKVAWEIPPPAYLTPEQQTIFLQMAEELRNYLYHKGITIVL